MAALRDSVAIIFGASSWPDYPGFEGQASFENSAQFIREYLQENGLGSGRLLWLFDDAAGPLEHARMIGDFLRDRRDSPGFKNLIVYYVGHGRTDQRGYCLALNCTADNQRTLSTFPAAELARLLNEHASDCRQFVILDACYAGEATADFVRNSVASSLREAARDGNRGTALLCAVASKATALAPAGEAYTVFSGGLRRALLEGDPAMDEMLTLEQLGELATRVIRERADARGLLPPPVSTIAGDVRTVPLFPNPSAARAPNATQFLALIADRDALRVSLDAVQREFASFRDETSAVGDELAWERDRHARGSYDLVDVHLEIDPFGDTAYTFRTRGILGPDAGEIRQIPYAFSSTPDFGTCVIERITDEQTRSDLPRANLPEAANFLTGHCELRPPALATRRHAGFTIQSRAVNAFAMTTRDGQFREQDDMEYTGIGPRYPARHLRLSILFPSRYAPALEPRPVARIKQLEQDEQPRRWPVDERETERVRNGVFWDRNRGLAVLSVERASAEFHYELEWPLPPLPAAANPGAAILAREQVRALFRLGRVDRQALDERLGHIRDEVCRTHFGLDRERASTVSLLLFLFDGKLMRVAGATRLPGTPGGMPEFRWGTGTVGMVMRRRAPHYVEADGEPGGGARAPVGVPGERFTLCIPVPLPSNDAEAPSWLRDPSMPCGIVSLGSPDEDCNFERLKEPTGAIFAEVSTDMAKRIVALVSEAAPAVPEDRRSPP